MATNTERIDQLAQMVTHLSAEQKLHAQQLQQLVEADRARRDEVAKLRDEFHQLRDEFRQAQREADVRTAVSDLKLADLKATQDRWSLRLWQFVIGFALATLGGVIGYLLKR